MNNFFDIREIEENLNEYREAASCGSSEHQERLGVYYWTKSDVKNTEKYLNLAANNGSVFAMVMLAEFYKNPPIINGQGSDIKGYETAALKSKHWNKKAAESGSSLSMFTLAEEYRVREKNEKLAFLWFKKGAELGDLNCYNNMGASYEFGVGVEQSEEKAFEWYLKAAEFGGSIELFNVGQCYKKGRGVAKNLEKAWEYYRESAEKGDPCACAQVGHYYMDGEIVERAPYEAYKWFRRGAPICGESAVYMADCYYKGYGVDLDYKKAFILFYRIATLGKKHAKKEYAMNKVAICLIEGRGVKKDPEEGVLWLKKSADLGNISAKLNLAKCYEEGVGVKKDAEKSWKIRKEVEEAAGDEYADEED